MADIIPIFYACDDNFAKYTIVSLRSMIDNASPNYQYRIHILNTGISDEHRQELLSMQNDRFTVTFPDVTALLETIADRLPIRDYYTKTTYFRLFIPVMFPQYDKAIYIDSDTVVLGDIAELYNHDLKDNYVGAVHEQAMVQEDVYGTYVETVVGIDRNAFFNAGLLLLNCKAFREKDLLGKFVKLLGLYNFVVTQDEDYLNVLCKDRVLWLHSGWNMEVFGEFPCPEEEMKIIHYIMVSKPWHYDDCRLQDHFWKYAEKTGVYQAIRQELADYTDEQRAQDMAGAQRLMETAIAEAKRTDHYMARVRQMQAPDRVAVLEKIDQLEQQGIFDQDVEQDPPTKPLLPEDIEYTKKKLSDNLKSKAAFFIAKQFVNKQMRQKNLIIKDMVGLENFRDLDSGAIITCNHFNAFDSFAIELTYRAAGHKDRKFYRVIREGNYTSFPGFYGILMRNCNTLPLSSNPNTMKKFIRGVNELLQAGHFILFYPEQSMWWNYRKPKPLKDGAFSFAAKNNVPVLPCFITMKDSDILGADGFYVQEYTIHVGKAIYPDPALSTKANVQMLKEENTRQWKEIYEQEYGMVLTYKTPVDRAV